MCLSWPSNQAFVGKLLQLVRAVPVVAVMVGKGESERRGDWSENSTETDIHTLIILLVHKKCRIIIVSCCASINPTQHT